MDIVSLVLIVGGGALYLRSYLGMQAIRNRGLTEFVRGESVIFGATNEHARLDRLAKVGLIVAVGGVLVGVSAAAYARRRRGAEPSPQG
jgi:hypothetical protein